MLTDLRLSLRSLAKSRGFAFIAVLTLGVGIGATTAIFSALRALVLEPFSYPASERLVHVWSGNFWPLSPADYLDLRAQSASFSAFGVYQPRIMNVGQEKAQSIQGAAGTADVLRVFGVQPLLGRFFTAADDEPGAPAVVILSHALWQQLFGGDPQAIGRKLRLDGYDAEVVGVMPANFEFVSPWMRTEDCQLWVPRSFDAKEKTQRDSHYLLGIARLRDGVTVPAADAEIKTIGRRLTAQYPDSNTRKAFLVRSLHEEMTRDIGQQVWLLFGAVALVLLVACGNVASMLLARSARRQGEFGVRVALGASRRALARLALAESLVLAGAGAVLGAGLAWGGVEVLRAFAPVSAARQAEIAVRRRQHFLLQPRLVASQRRDRLVLRLREQRPQRRRLREQRLEFVADQRDRPRRLLDRRLGVNPRRILQVDLDLRDHRRHRLEPLRDRPQPHVRRRELPRRQQVDRRAQAVVVEQRIPGLRLLLGDCEQHRLELQLQDLRIDPVGARQRRRVDLRERRTLAPQRLRPRRQRRRAVVRQPVVVAVIAELRRRLRLRSQHLLDALARQLLKRRIRRRRPQVSRREQRARNESDDSALPQEPRFHARHATDAAAPHNVLFARQAADYAYGAHRYARSAPSFISGITSSRCVGR